MSTYILVWAVALMASWHPLDKKSPWPELRDETVEQRRERYTELAEAAKSVAFDSTNPPLFDGLDGRERTMVLLLSVAYHESAFHNRVTSMRGSDKKRSDHGRSWCAMQILLGRDGVGKRKGGHLGRLIPEGWTGPQLEADPKKCLLVGYRFLQASFDRCAKVAVELRAGAYTGEGCGRAPKSKSRVSRALQAPLPARGPLLSKLDD